MKRMLAVSTAFVLIFSVVIFAGDKKESKEVDDKTVESLLIGLASDNYGLKTSSAYMLGELKVTDAIIPLMRMLREDEREEARIVAALSLYKIGTPLSIHAVRQAIQFDDCERVKKLCTLYVNDFYSDKDSKLNYVASK